MTVEFETLLNEVARDVKSNRKEAQMAFELYRNALSAPLRRYVGPRFKGKRDRYEFEVAAINILAILITHDCYQRGFALNYWNIPDPQIYNWYKMPSALRKKVMHLTKDGEYALLPLLDIAAEWILNQGRRDRFGEFYTPLVFAQHIVDGLGFENSTLINTRIADPACGSGILLGEVASRLQQLVVDGVIDATVTASKLNDIFHGFDVQPIAVHLTRLRLMVTFLPLIGLLKGRCPNSFFSFPNIKRQDALAEPEAYWHLFAQFTYIAGNPPFAKVVSERIPYLQQYEDILSGQPNLYQLFLWWSVQSLLPGGRLSFLIPQSLRSGAYFRKLRTQIAETCDIVSITQFSDRYAFEAVDSPLMIVVLEKKGQAFSQATNVQIRVSRNGHEIYDAPIINVPQMALLSANGHGPIWHISNQVADYELLERINLISHEQPSSRQHLAFHNGGFVWNQHKSILRKDGSERAAPLLYASAFKRFEFTFPPEETTTRSHKQYALATTKVRHLEWNGPCVLVKRTTAKKWGHRITAALLPSSFYSEHPSYFAENHLNLIRPTTKEDSSLLPGIAGWLNSRLLSFVFQMMNGSSHLSLEELMSFSYPLGPITRLGPLTMDIMRARAERRLRLIDDLDQIVYEYFGLSPNEINRVNTWII